METDSQNLNDMRVCVTENLGAKIESAETAFGELTFTVNRDNLISVLRWLRDDAKTRFIALMDICGVDYPHKEERFDIVYHLLSPRHNLRARVIVPSDADEPVPSAIGLFRAADWYEREVYDMYGIRFSDHPDLRRLLTDYGFEGYPLRKDFPLSGFSQTRYDDEQKRVIYEPVELKQEFRDFDFLSPWQGTDYVLPEGEEDSKSPVSKNGNAAEKTGEKK